MNLNKRFPKKRIIITGAGSGLGRALALEFAKMNWNIAIAEINKERAEETAALVKQKGGQPEVIICDVTKPNDLTKAASILKSKWNGVDILVNNAGIVMGGYFEKILLENWEKIININQKSIIYGCRAFIPLLKEQGFGYIVNTASSAGIASLPEMVSYNMTKAAVISASETLRVELAPHKIGVSVVCPTFFRTNIMDQFTSPDIRQRKLGDKLFENAKTTAEQIATHVVRSIQKNRLYVITQLEGKFAWWSKRYTPEIYFRVLAFLYRTKLFEKYYIGLK